MAICSALVSSDVAKIIAEVKFRFSLASCGFFLLGLIQVGLLAYWHYNSVFMSLFSLLLFGLVFITSTIVVSNHINSTLGLHFWATWSVGGIGLLLGQKVAHYLTKEMSNFEYSNVINNTVNSAVNSTVNSAQNSALLGHATTEMIPLLFTGISIVIFIFAIPICTMLRRDSLHNDRQSHEQVNSHEQINRRAQANSHERSNSHNTFCPKNWCLHLGRMGLIFASMILAALFGRWLFAGEEGNSLAEHYYNLTLLALFSTCIYHLLTKRVAMMLD
jgi:hypothetical protein